MFYCLTQITVYASRLAMAQDVSTENVHLEVEGGAKDVYSPLRDILRRKDRIIENQRAILPTNYSMPLRKTMLSKCGSLWKGIMIWSGWNMESSEMTLRKSRRKWKRNI